MSTSYENLYANLLPKFQSYKIPIMTTDEVKEYLHDYIIPAVTRFHVCVKDLSKRDDENECFESELSETEIEILSNYMLIEYVDSEYIRTPTLLKVNLTSSDFNAFSPANFLDKLMAMRSRYISENEGLLSRYAWLGAIENGYRLGAGYKKSNASISTSTTTVYSRKEKH